MRKILTAVVTLIFAGTVHAEAPCLNSCQLCGDFEVGIHALAFTPMLCEYDFATIADGEGNIPTATVACDLDWGFRVFGRYLSDCSFAHLSYQWYESQATKGVEAPFNTFRGGFLAENGKAELHLEYQNFDVRVGTYLHRGCDCRFFFFGNVRWIDLHYRRTVKPQDGMGTDLLLNEKSDFEGAALGLGAGVELDLPCNFEAFGDANFLGVFAQRSATDVVTNNAGDRAPVSYETDDCISPEMAWRLGLSYTYACSWLNIRAEIGYELDYFTKAIAFPQNQTEGRRLLNGRFRQCEDVGFSGLFFGLHLSF